MYNPSPYGSPYPDPSSYGRILPKPTSSGTLENDVKRQKIGQPSPYYIPPYQYGQSTPIVAPTPAPAPAPVPAPYYSPSAPTTYGPYWSQPVYRPPNFSYVATQPALAPIQDSLVPKMGEAIKEPSKESSNFEPSDEEENADDEEDGDNGEQGDQSSSIIQGTSITLATEEDITKWREERKRMWLLKISNKRIEHMERMGIKEEELRGHSILQESKKQKQFIQNIQNQVNRTNPKANLNIKIVQRVMAQENLQLLQFIKELGDCNLLEHELTAKEKSKLFGSPEDKQRNAKKTYTRSNGNNSGNTRRGK